MAGGQGPDQAPPPKIDLTKLPARAEHFLGREVELAALDATRPDGDTEFSLRWRLIKHYLASGIPSATNRRGGKSVWQRRFWEHAIRGEEDWRTHVDYVHYNPVRHG